MAQGLAYPPHLNPMHSPPQQPVYQQHYQDFLNLQDHHRIMAHHQQQMVASAAASAASMGLSQGVGMGALGPLRTQPLAAVPVAGAGVGNLQVWGIP